MAGSLERCLLRGQLVAGVGCAGSCCQESSDEGVIGRMDRTSHIARFYLLLEEASRRSGGVRQMSACTGRDSWPARGVYFFFEPGQSRTQSGVGPRVVRVGTHALKAGSKTSLWTRLSQHRGSKSTSRGSHRGSSFRLLVGAALIERDGLECSSWGAGSSAPPGVRLDEGAL